MGSMWVEREDGCARNFDTDCPKVLHFGKNGSSWSRLDGAGKCVCLCSAVVVLEKTLNKGCPILYCRPDLIPSSAERIVLRSDLTNVSH